LDDDPGDRRRAMSPHLCAGTAVGAFLRFSASLSAALPHTGRPVFSADLSARPGVSEFWDLPRRPTAGIFAHNDIRRHFMGADRGPPFEKAIFLILGANFPSFFLSRWFIEKIFPKNLVFYKKTICIWKKIGYNKME
jgi:hypothetical protein